MKKHRITIVVEFNANPEDYEGLDTDDERLAVDMEMFDRYPGDIANFDYTITGEVIDAKVVQQGKFKLMPEEPSLRMLKATDNTPEEYSEWIETHTDRNRRIYKAMFKAFKGEVIENPIEV